MRDQLLLVLAFAACVCCCGTRAETTRVDLETTKRTPVELAAPEVELDDVTYRWTVFPETGSAELTDGADGDPALVIFASETSGVVMVTADVRDGDVLLARREYVIEVRNIAPTVTVDASLATTTVPGVLSATAESPDSDPLTFQWTVVSAPPGATPAFSAANSSETEFSTNLAGDYEVAVTVDDSDGGVVERRHVLPVFGPVFDPVEIDGAFSCTTGYSSPRRELAVAGIDALHIISVDDGTLTSDPSISDGRSIRGISPDGSLVAVAESFAVDVYDLDARAVIYRSTGDPSAPQVLSNEALYVVKMSPSDYLEMVDLTTALTYQAPTAGEYLSWPIVSSTLETIFVPSRDGDRFFSYSFDAPPVELAVGQVMKPWFQARALGLLADGRRLLRSDGSIADISADPVTTTAEPGTLGEVVFGYAHNPAAGVVALTLQSHDFAFYTDDTYELVGHYSTARWLLDAFAATRMYPFDGGFLLIQCDGDRIQSLYVRID